MDHRFVKKGAGDLSDGEKNTLFGSFISRLAFNSLEIKIRKITQSYQLSARILQMWVNWLPHENISFEIVTSVKHNSKTLLEFYPWCSLSFLSKLVLKHLASSFEIMTSFTLKWIKNCTVWDQSRARMVNSHNLFLSIVLLNWILDLDSSCSNTSHLSPLESRLWGAWLLSRKQHCIF